MQAPDLEVILEVSEREIESNLGRAISEEPKQETIPSLQESKVEELWEEVRRHKEQEEGSINSAPFSVIHLTHSIESD